MIAEPESEVIDMDVVRQDAREDLLLYSQLCDHRYRPARFHYFVGEHLAQTVHGKSKRQMHNSPPQHGKTTLTAVEYATWRLGRNPRLKVVVASYGQTLCEKASRLARDRIRSSEFQSIFPECLPNYNKWAANEWYTTHGGGYKAVGVDKGFTGFSCDLLIIDDPHKDFAEAQSIVSREHVWNWFLSVAMTRLNPDSVIIIIGTRWHPDDLCGRLLNPDFVRKMEDMGFPDAIYEHYNFTGIAEEGDILGRMEGDALWPSKFPKSWIRMQMAVLGSHISEALYMGRPTQKGGNYIHSDDFVIVSEKDVPVSQLEMRYWDIAETAKKSSDYTVGTKGFHDAAGNLWITDMIRGKWIWPKARSMIIQTASVEKILVGFEKTSMTSAFDNLQEVMASEAIEAVILGIEVDSEKLVRALPWIALTERRKVFLVRRRENDWIPACVNECDEFGPGCKNDDIIDSISGLHKMLKESGNWHMQNVPRAGEVEQFRASRSRTLI